MLIALVCLIYTNLIQLYALCRFLILVNFLNQLFPIVPGTERVRLPALCYGRCGHLFGVYLFIAAWVVTLAVLNLTRLRSFFLGRRDLAAERAEKQKQFDETSRKLDVERDAGVCSFYFVNADYLRNYQLQDLPIPIFGELLAIPAAVVQKDIVLADAMLGKHTPTDFCIVSHRWFHPKKPDDGTQFLAIQEHLQHNLHIKYVWYDYWSMPQGERTPSEKASFANMLAKVNVLYATCHVLILLDLSYMSRFWTQYEAWLSLQTLSAHGLSPAAEADRRCQIVPIQNANSTVVEALLTMWANKTPQEAHTVLSKSDIAVTNDSDKENHLPKILSYHAEVQKAFAAASDANDPCSHTRVQPLANPEVARNK